MLYMIGLGLGDVDDVTVKGLNAIKKCARVYLEAYTSILSFGLNKQKLEEFYGCAVILADRDMVEQGCDEILAGANETDVAFLVVGDPFGATTHSDLVLRAKEKDIDVKVIHNASIINAVGCTGLQLYNFGETVSIVFWTDTWKPESFYDKIEQNLVRGLHTLCLLDIKVKEQSEENLCRGRKIYEPPRYMTVNTAAEQLMQVYHNRIEKNLDCVYKPWTTCVGLARVGCVDQNITACSMENMQHVQLGAPLHSLIICGTLHPLELEMLNTFSLVKL